MGFLTKAAREEDTADPEANLEDTYMQMFPKIGRDFVHREDLIAILRELLSELGLDGVVNIEQDAGARGRAREYQSMMDQGKKGNEVYQDLINPEEEEGDRSTD